MKLFISAKCRDLFDFQLVTDDLNHVATYDGYVPKSTGVGSGDYISFTVDTETGKIENWSFDLRKLIEECNDLTKGG